MGLCPICGKQYCDHTAEERGQTSEEMMAPLTPEEEERKQLNDNENWINTLIECPSLADNLDWEKIGNRIEGRTRILERQPGGTLKIINKS